MNSGSEKKLSMDELLEKNRPAQMVQTTPQLPAQELTTPPEVHPMKAEWEELLSSLCTLGYHTERQTGYLKKVNELLAQLPTRTQMDELLKEEKISKETAKVVRSSQISWFVRSAVGKRMKEAFVLGTLHREQQFVMSIDASERNPAWNQGEQILVQGIIDAFWEEADGLVLVDYKTDHVKEGQELIDRYQRQMHYYSQALERAYGKKVKECYLYSFALGKAVAVEV